MSINADARIEAGLFDEGEQALHSLDPGRLTYVHLARGQLTVNGHALRAGDGALLDGESQLHLADGKKAEVLVFDLTRD